TVLSSWLLSVGTRRKPKMPAGDREAGQKYFQLIRRPFRASCPCHRCVALQGVAESLVLEPNQVEDVLVSIATLQPSSPPQRRDGLFHHIEGRGRECREKAPPRSRGQVSGNGPRAHRRARDGAIVHPSVTGA